MAQQSLIWPVDCHVHFHQVDRVAQTLDAAADNFRNVAGRSEGLLGALLLTQAARETVFETLEAIGSVTGDWALEVAQNERETIIARNGRVSLAIVCGRQVRAADGLEVLGLGTRETISDGLPFFEVIEAVRRSGALTVIPWAFGKWLGERGKQVENAFASHGTRELFVGDNGSRLAMIGRPALMRALEERGFRVLPGTDPFPFGGGHRRVGRFGLVVEFTPSVASPWADLRTWLMNRAVSPRPFGHASGPLQFAFNQVGIQVYNRFFRKRPG